MLVSSYTMCLHALTAAQSLTCIRQILPGAVVPVSTPNDTAEPQLLSMSPEQVGGESGAVAGICSA